MQVLPVERGAGLAQPGIRAAEARLASGDWVHIFPEGTRSRDGLMGPMRKGVGRLVASCSQPPLGAAHTLCVEVAILQKDKTARGIRHAACSHFL